MTCDFSRDDGAYVLGALSPSERAAFKQHLPGCPECTHAVAELAELPGLLGRVDPAVLDGPPPDEPAPVLLPGLVREVRRARRRRALTTGGLAAAAAAVVVVVPLGIAQLGDEPAPPPAPESSETPQVAAQQMDPVGQVPVQATVRLEGVTWGTRLGLSCTYDPDWVAQDLPEEADYVLFVRTRSGQLEQVGSWRAVGGRAMEITAATAATPADVRSVQVRTTDGRVVLRLST